jgi:thiol:disulfide interchange protein DsbC
MKFSITRLLPLFAVFLFATNSFADDACLATGISVEEAKKVLKPILGKAKVVGVAEAPIEGFYEVDIFNRGKVFPIYLDCNKNYIISGEIIDLKKGKSLTRERMKELASKAKEIEEKQIKEKEKELKNLLGEKKFEELKKVAPKSFLKNVNVVELKNVPEPTIVIGSPKAKYKVIIIEDPECPACAMMHDEILKAVEKRNDIKFEIYLFPLSFHKYARGIASNIICATSQKEKAEILHKSFENVKERNVKGLEKLEKECPKAEKTLKEVEKFAREVRLSGTPTIIFPPGLSLTGVLQADDIIKIVDALK